MGRSDDQLYTKGQFLPMANGGSSTLRTEELVGYGAFAELYNVFCVKERKNYAVKVEKPR